MKITLHYGDICETRADVICASTNANLELMAGTGGAIRTAGGNVIQDECKAAIADAYERTGKKFLPLGSAVLVTAGSLPHRGAIMCVAIDTFHRSSRETIIACMTNALQAAAAMEPPATSVGMPVFATGHGTFDFEDGVQLMIETARDLAESPIRELVLVTHDRRRRDIVQRHVDAAANLFPHALQSPAPLHRLSTEDGRLTHAKPTGAAVSEAIAPTDDLDDLLQRGFRYAVSLTHDEHLARDVLQDACVALSRRGGPWHRGYLFAAIRNRVIDLHRRDQRVAWSPLEDPDTLVDESDGPGSRDLEEPFAADDEELRTALGQLRPEAREALFLSIVEGLTAAEIAGLTGRPRGTVLSHIHRGRQQLRRLLAHREGSVQS